jgi:REP element-mobilizing transposase RayT
MARLARLVVPGLPHHMTQRGNHRQQTFFSDEDYAAYVELLAAWCTERGVEIWVCCLMPNHVHLIAVPRSEDAPARAIGEAHRRYTRRVNFRERWRGYLWQGRCASFVLDEPYLLAAARYVELNPVRAGLVGDRSGLAVEQCPVAPVAPGRPTGASRSHAGDGRRLACVAGQRNSPRAASRPTRAWTHRLSARERHVCATFGAKRPSHPPPWKTRPPIQIAQTSIIGSCPRNSCEECIVECSTPILTGGDHPSL